MKLTKSQTEALDALLFSVDRGDRLVSLAGSAGTGKTTLIQKLVDCLGTGSRFNDFDDSFSPSTDSRSVVVVTPTNKAAQVLNTKGIPAATLYSVFYILLEDVKDPRTGKTKPTFIACHKWLQQYPGSANEGRLVLQEKGKTDRADVIIVDEASLLTHFRIRELQGMCSTLILVGDHHQLPPVGDRDFPEGFFTQLDHTVVLTEVMRQQEGSLILGLAEELRADGPRVDRMLRSFEPPESFPELVRAGAQMIAFTNKERQRINHVCRRVLGFDKPWPMPGDRILVTNNHSDDLINGTVVGVLDFVWNGRSDTADIKLDVSGEVRVCRVDMRSFAADQIGPIRDQLEGCFPDKTGEEEGLLEITFAYCVTAHKAQGSEWDTVVVFDQRGLIRKIQSDNPYGGIPPSEYVRRWTYTSITRARQRLVFAPTWYAKSY